ncbi:MAG: SusC/RagA family TonB-linked outer membrane protein [Gemmatimonadetes bacterium]|nr:SusC/RagA family TonB-linked outer membrane protein [Gemmatimonadota bacterium]
MHGRRIFRRCAITSLAALALLAPGRVLAQQAGRVTVTGTVVQAEDRRPLAGAQVQLRGTNQGALTGPDGRFSFEAAAPVGNYTLAVSFLGRRTATRPITLPSSGTVTVETIALEQSAVELSEVVVTAPGVAQERRAMGNQVSSVGAAELNRAPAAIGVGEALQGKVPGAVITQSTGQPGGGMTIRLRGSNSILGSAEPLIVVDGTIIDDNTDGLIGLNANLSGANRSGSSISSRLADISPDEIENIDILKGASAAALYGSRAKNGVVLITTKRGHQGRPQFTFGTDVTVGSTPKKYDLVTIPIAGWGDVSYGTPTNGPIELGGPVTRYDLQDMVWRTAVGNNTHASLSGASGGTSYFLSGSYVTDQGIVRSSDYRKTQVRAKVSQQLGSLLNVTANGSFVQSLAHYVPEGEQTFGVLSSVIFTPTSWNPNYDPSTGRYPYNPLLGPNPLEILKDWEAPDQVTRFIGNFEANFQPTAKLRLHYLFGLDDYRDEAKLYMPPFSTSASFTGSISNPVLLARQFNHDLTAAYDARFSPSFGLTSTLGFRYTSSRNNTLRLGANDLVPGLDIVNGATQVASQGITEIRTVGAFLQEQANLADRFYITAGANLEASSAFGADQRWQLFPRVNASYVLSDAPAWKESAIGSVLSTLRLRGAYGETGGQPPGAYQRFNNYVGTSFSGRPGLVASSVQGNPDLKPERQREFEGGFDVGLFQDRANLQFTYYNQDTKDLVLSVPAAPSSGFTSQFQNIGEVTNHGVEIALNTINIARPGFEWSTRLGFAASRNKVKKLVTSNDTILFGYLNYVIEGQPLGVFYGGQYARNPDGTIAYDTFTVNGQTNRYPYLLKSEGRNGTQVNKILGDPNPDWTANLSNTFRFGRNVQLNVLLDGRFGNDVANFSRRIQEIFGVSKRVEAEIKGDTTFRAFTLAPGSRSLIYEEFIEDGSFVKLREVALSVRLPESLTRRIGSSQAELRVAGRNLYTWTKYSGLDPEVNLFGASPVAQGVDFANTPLPRQFVFGLNFTY